MYSRTRLETRATDSAPLHCRAAAIFLAAACLGLGLRAVQAAPPRLGMAADIARSRHVKLTPGRVPAPPDSYLKYKVYNLNQLLDQIQSNPAILKLYARHFGRSQNRIVSYMRSDLVESYVPTTTKYKVYCVRPNGQIYAVTQTFKRGTKVFALRNGQPVMKWVCGNPLSRSLPPVETKYVKSPPPKVTGKPSVEELISDTEDVIVPSELDTPVLQASVPTSAASEAIGATPIFSGGSANFGAVGGVAAVAAGTALLLTSTGGSTSSSTPSGGTTPITPIGPGPGAVVPEPGLGAYGVALFLVAGGFLLRRPRAPRRVRVRSRPQQQ